MRRPIKSYDKPNHRHARARPGHPHASTKRRSTRKDVDGRVKPGQDRESGVVQFDREAL